MGQESGARVKAEFFRSPQAAAASALLGDLAARLVPCTPREVDKPLVLYGAGNLGRMAKTYLDRLGVEYLYVVDAKPQCCRDDPFWGGVDLVSPQSVAVEQRKQVLLAVCIATTPYCDLQALLSEDGWDDVVPFYDIAEACRDRHTLGNGWFVETLSGLDVERIEQVLARWGDDASRAHHLQFIAWHGLREDWRFADAPVCADDRYFIAPLCQILKDDEVFVDVGAHHGEVSLKFMRIVDSRFKEVWMIEPDPDNLRQLRAELEEKGLSDDARLHVLACAVSEHQGSGRFFEGAGYASKLSELGRAAVDVKTIDQLGVAPTFIKLHLEGGELAALKGGRETIRMHRPLIAATTYHNRMGLWELPGWLMDSLPDYIFLWRQHSWCGTGAVMYCIPRERAHHAVWRHDS